MSYQRGTNAGLSGLVDIPGVGALFEVQIFRWKTRLTGSTRQRRGRGGGVYRTLRWVFSAGTVACSGKFNLDGWPSPSTWKGQTGTLTFQVHTSKTIAYPILITAMGPDFDEKTEDLPDVVFACEITGEPTYTGWGAAGQPAATDPSKSDQEQWEATTKTKDTGNLESIAIRTTDVWGTLANTDSAEYTKLAAVIAAAQVPFSGMKLNTAVFARDAIDGGTVTETWQLTTSDERVINAASEVTTDPNVLTSHAITAAFNTTPPVSGTLIERETSLKEYTDGMVLHTTNYGVRDTRDDVEMPGTITANDVSDLEDTATVTKQTTSSTPPTVPSAPLGLHHQTDTEQLDRVNWKHVFHYANTTPQQRVEFGGTSTQVDPSALTDNYEETIVNGSSTPPATPTTGVSGTKLRRRISKRIGGTPEKWSHQFIFDRRTTEDDIEMDGSSISVDSSTIQDRTEITIVTASGTPPTEPGAAGLQLIDTRTKQRHDTKWAHTFIYEQTTNQQKMEYAKTYDEVDPQGLESKSALAAMDSTPSTPGGLVLRSTRTESVTPDHDLVTVEAGERSTADDETFGRTKVEIDRNSIKIGQESYTAEIITTGAVFALPSAPSTGMVCTNYFDIPRTNAGTSNKSVRVYVWSLTTNGEKLTQPRYSNEVDPNDLDTTVRSATVWDGTSAPSDPALTGIRSGLKLVSKTDIGLSSHPTTLVRVYLHEKNDSVDKIILPRTTFEATSFLAQRAVNASIIATTNVASFTGNATFLSLKDQVTFEKVEAVKTDPDHTLQVITTQTAAKIVRGRSSGTRRVITPAYLDGSDVYVFMRRKIKIGSNAWDYELAEQYIAAEKICFSITQRVSGSTLPMHPELLNTCNGGSFLGLAAGFVKYLGMADFASNIAVATNRVSEVTWEFEYDSLGAIDLADASPGWGFTTDDLTSIGPGWVKASDLGLSSSALGTGDYSVFA